MTSEKTHFLVTPFVHSHTLAAVFGKAQGSPWFLLHTMEMSLHTCHALGDLFLG
jgi:hypothetical protein